ncbi:peptidoglycan hydrolase-like protein with peptidoglycan-binding domain [Rhodoligotrophos appendicifer]|uniref:peptidoglycan-binding domain-containing protein n=1 Tax=Rhodoligotrophos appendicifer TaxID=987056 RepID=UPI0011860807|nr:peptidoglycan-binding domain-containing protein [Rhodoligotrophos appendicifer]
MAEILVKDVLEDTSPVLSLRGAVCLGLVCLFAGAISYNALFAQAGKQLLAPNNVAGVQPSARPKAQALPAAKPAALPSSAVSKTPMGETPAKPATASLIGSIQSELSLLGYYTGPVDGTDGAATQAAIRAYQSKRGLPVTGQATAGLLEDVVADAQFLKASQFGAEGATTAAPSTAAAAPPAALAPVAGDEGEREKTKLIQQGLAELGYSPGPADGIAGAQTRQAISQFQKDRDLPATGQIDGATLRELGKVTGVTSFRDG